MTPKGNVEDRIVLRDAVGDGLCSWVRLLSRGRGWLMHEDGGQARHPTIIGEINQDIFTRLLPRSQCWRYAAVSFPMELWSWKIVAENGGSKAEVF